MIDLDKPIRRKDGESSTCRVVSAVRVTRYGLMGEAGDGWTVDEHDLERDYENVPDPPPKPDVYLLVAADVEKAVREVRAGRAFALAYTEAGALRHARETGDCLYPSLRVIAWPSDAPLPDLPT